MLLAVIRNVFQPLIYPVPYLFISLLFPENKFLTELSHFKDCIKDLVFLNNSHKVTSGCKNSRNLVDSIAVHILSVIALL